MTGKCSVTWKRQVRFEYGLDPSSRIRYMLSTQGRFGGVSIHPELHSGVQTPYGWTDDIYHVGSALDSMSFFEEVPVAGGTRVRHGRQTCFYTGVDLVSFLCSRFDTK